MTIPCNKNITKQLNSYSYIIIIILQDLLQRTKQALSNDGARGNWPLHPLAPPLVHSIIFAIISKTLHFTACTDMLHA
jgi:hypothetical protein